MLFFVLILNLLITAWSRSFSVPIFAASRGSQYYHSVDKLANHIRTAVDDVRENFNVQLNVTIIESDCAPDVAVNRMVAIVRRGWEQPNLRPVALVGFTCDAEYDTIGSLAGKWKLPIITAGMRRIMNDMEHRTKRGLDTTVRTGVNGEIIGKFVHDLLRERIFKDGGPSTGIALLHVETSSYGYPTSKSAEGDCSVYMNAISEELTGKKVNIFDDENYCLLTVKSG